MTNKELSVWAANLADGGAALCREDQDTMREMALRLEEMPEGVHMEVGFDAERFIQANHEKGFCRSRWHIGTTVHTHRFPLMSWESPGTLILHATEESGE